MELMITGVVFLLITLAMRRREALQFRWQPTRDTWVAIGTGVLAILLSASMLLLQPGSVAARILHYGMIYVFCGAVVPWGYTVMVERNTPAALGVKRERVGYSRCFSTTDLSTCESRKLSVS